jgi:polyhydroxyalkanoate synthase subunit PhaE
MSAKNKGPESIQDWQALHQQWWGSLLEGAKQYAPAAGFNPNESMKGFGDLFGNKLGSENNAAVERFLAGSKQFLQWVEGLSSQIAARGGIPGKVDDWSALFKQSAGPMFEGSNPFLHLFQGLSSDGARGFEQFMAGMPNPAEAFKGELKGMLGTPAFGFNREQQERAQQFLASQMEYQEAMAAYNAQMLRASKLAFEKLELKLAEREEPGRQLESLRAVYDLWIDAAEDAYAEVALSADFREAYGNLVNKQMRMRQQLQAEVERQTAQLGMPARSELNSVHKRMQEMRRRIRELEDRLEAAAAPAAPRPVAPVAATRPAAPAKKKASGAPVKAAAKKVKPAIVKAAPVAKPRTSKGSKPARKAATARRHLNRLA